MHLALYRKYRSKSFTEVLGQKHITDTLARALKQSKIRHAYLFTGPHGVGKTSVARILAHEITKLPYDESSHLDIVEIDAASNRRIDEIRDLREKARIAPSQAPYKVYIIDEVHMLTNEAFNALLKTLEEPPSHVVFILATTEAHKLPQTIVSRTQRFQFHPIEHAAIKSRLKEIATAETLDIDEKAFEMLADHARGSFRDAISLLDQASASNSEKTLTVEDVQSLLGIARSERIESLIKAVRSGDVHSCRHSIQSMRREGFEPAAIASQLIENIVSHVTQEGSQSQLELGDKLLQVQSSSLPQYALEVTLLQACIQNHAANEKKSSHKIATPKEQQPITTNDAEAVKERGGSSTTQDKTGVPKKASDASQAPHADRAQSTKVDDAWSVVLRDIKKSHNALYAILRMSVARYESNHLEIAFKFPFHHKRIEQTAQRKRVEDAVYSAYGKNTTISTVVDEAVELPSISVDDDIVLETPNTAASQVLDIMGGGEVIAYKESS